MTIGTKAVYRPVATGSPATVAWAIAFGRTTAAAVIPATMSTRTGAAAVGLVMRTRPLRLQSRSDAASSALMTMVRRFIGVSSRVLPCIEPDAA